MTDKITGAKQTSAQPAKAANPQPEPAKAAKQPNSIMVGGVKYDAKDVKSHSTTRGMIQFGSDKVYKEGEYHEVVLKDGTKITYNSSLEKGDFNNINERNLVGQAEVQIEKDGTVNFKGLHNAQITDTPKDDTYRLLGCEFTHVQAARTKDETSGIIFVDHVVSGADNDTVIFGDRELPNGDVQKSFQSTATLASGDAYQKADSYAGTNVGNYEKGRYHSIRYYDDNIIGEWEARYDVQEVVTDRDND